MLNEVKVIICGKEYKIKTAEAPNYVFALARALETKINEITAASGSSPYAASIMVSLALLDDLNKANQRLDNIRGAKPPFGALFVPNGAHRYIFKKSYGCFLHNYLSVAF